jgi:MFS family permease
MAQTAGRGTSWVSVVLGWLAALGAALILSSIVGAIVGALFAALGAKSGTTGGGISGVIGLLLTLLIAFYLGGYAAGRMASRSGVKHGLLVALLALVVTIVLALIGAAVGASFIDQLGGVTLPGPAGKAAQNVPQQGLTTILSVSGIFALLVRSSGEHLGVHVGPESDKGAPIHPQEGTAKIWIEGRDASSLGPIIRLSNEARRSRVDSCS